MRMRSGLVALLLPAILTAQREPLRQPAAVPLELAAALASGGGFAPGADPNVLVGELPEWMANRILLPAGARVLGSAFAGSTVVGVVQVLQSDRDFIRDMDTALAGKGWRVSDFGPRGGGFRFLATPQGSEPLPSTFCAPDGMLTIRLGPSRQGRQIWFYRMTQRRTGFDPCNPPPGGRRSSPYPALYHPADATRETSGMFGCEPNDPRARGAGGGTGDRIRTSMSPDSLLGHYGRQLVDSGWTTTNVTAKQVTQWWTRADSTGAQLHLKVAVTSSGGNPACRDLDLMVYGAQP